MNILAIDTSTSCASLAVAADREIVAESLVNTNRTLSARIIPEIERLLATTGLTIADIDLFVSSLGPGSFTGVRGGVATMQGLALATGKPCAGFSSLTMLAMNFSLAKFLICPLIDARKNEVYGALYDCSSPLPFPHITDCVLPPRLLLDQIQSQTADPVIFVGDGAVRYCNLITEQLGGQAIFAPLAQQTPRAANGIMLALDVYLKGQALDPSHLLPVYLRASDAEINKSKASPVIL
jgi:tRNA threonylcarbamoyladenosine biosynthesis protein TsaB